MDKKTLYIFDFDDTLVRNQEVDFKSFDLIIKKHNLPTLSRKTLLLLRRKGCVAKDIFSTLTNAANDDVDLLVAERKAILDSEKIWSYLRVNAGVKAALRKIKEKGDIAIIISKKRSDLIKKIMRDLGLNIYIQSIHTAKDKAALIREILKRKHPAKAVFVSDSEDDLASVKKLGASAITTYCFYNPYKNIAAMRRFAKVIKNMREIL